MLRLGASLVLIAVLYADPAPQDRGPRPRPVPRLVWPFIPDDTYLILRVECDNRCAAIYFEDKDQTKSTKLDQDTIKKAPYISPDELSNSGKFKKRLGQLRLDTKTRPTIVKTYNEGGRYAGIGEWKSVYEILVPRTTAIITIYAENKDTANPDMPDNVADKDVDPVVNSQERRKQYLHLDHMTDGNPGGIKYELFTATRKPKKTTSKKTPTYKMKKVLSRSSNSRTIPYKNPKKDIEISDGQNDLQLWYGSHKKVEKNEMDKYWESGYDTSSWTKRSDLSFSTYDSKSDDCTDGGWCVTQRTMSKKEPETPFFHAKDQPKALPEWITNVEGTNPERKKMFLDDKKSGMKDRFHTAYIARICVLGLGDACKICIRQDSDKCND